VPLVQSPARPSKRGTVAVEADSETLNGPALGKAPPGKLDLNCLPGTGKRRPYEKRMVV
jgi:hypothetical protein